MVVLRAISNGMGAHNVYEGYSVIGAIMNFSRL